MSPRVAVVGAGPAGLTAAYRLRAARFDVDVLEREAVAGGRTHSEHFGPGHWSDTGAGWLASFYPEALALLDEIGQRHLLSPLQLRGGGELQLDGRNVPTPNSVRRILETRLMSPADKVRFFAYMARLLVTQRGDLAIDEHYDAVAAVDELAAAGITARERVIRPNFEGPFFGRLEEMSASLIRSWLRVLSIGTFFHVEGGMDAPWRHLADLLAVKAGRAVERVELDGDGAVVHTANGSERYDAVVLATPAPVTARLLDDVVRPAALERVSYVPHVRLYAARRGAGPARSGVHVFPNDIVATVEFGSGRFGAWGQVPDDWAWALVCAPGPTSGPLLDLPEQEVIDRLWHAAKQIDGRLFDLADAEVVHLVRWSHAVPLVDPGYYGRIASLQQRPPIVYAGDWLVQPCVEGAVRSGNRAARILVDHFAPLGVTPSSARMP